MSEKEYSPEQISLRPLNINNISHNCVKWLNDHEINQFLEIRHNPPKTLEEIICFVHQCEVDKRHHWGIFVDEKHIGNISCSAYNNKYRWVDISIIIGEKRFWGKSIAKPSLAGAINYLFKVGNFHRIQAGAYSINCRSIKLFEALGFKKEAVLRESVLINNNFIDVVKLGLLEHEWDKKRKSIEKAKVLNMKWEVNCSNKI